MAGDLGLSRGIHFISESFAIGGLGTARFITGSRIRGTGGIDAHWAEHIKLQRPIRGRRPELVKM